MTAHIGSSKQQPAGDPLNPLPNPVQTNPTTSEGGARGVLGTVTAVKTQQSEIDAPLDDLVVNGRLPDGTSAPLIAQQPGAAASDAMTDARSNNSCVRATRRCS